MPMARVISVIDRFLSALTRRVNWISFLAITIMMAFVFVDVILRYLGHPTTGSNDIVQLLLVITVAFAMGYTQVLKRHPSIAILVPRLPLRAQGVIHIITSFLSMIIFALLAWRSATLARHLWIHNEGTMTLGFPLYPLVYCISFGSVLMFLVLISDFLKAIFKEARGWTQP
jgi:TRAP-type C4-dicarboxylate transport system permease small subunit